MSSATYTLKAELRDARGKEKAAKLRQTGNVPAVLYGAHKDPVALTINVREFETLRTKTHGEQVLIDVHLPGGSVEKALIRDVQRDPLSQNLLHADLQRVSMTEAISVRVPVLSVGLAYGVKNDGGLLEQVTRTITVRCLPTAIPPHIEVDVTELRNGQSIHLADIKAPANVEFTDDGKTVLFAVVGKVKEEELAPGAAPATTAEPEVIKKKKEDAAAAAPAKK